jgi:hypothetical protein
MFNQLLLACPHDGNYLGSSLVYYSAGVAGLASFGAAQALPQGGPLWLVARLTLDGAGGLFGLYMLIGFGLTIAGHAMRGTRRQTPPIERRPW